MNKKRIIIIDDNIKILETMELILTIQGYTVAKAEDGRKGLKKLLEAQANHKQYDLIITDIKMPNLNGLEVIDSIKAHNINVPIFAISGFGTKELKDKLSSKGCSAYLDKPISKKGLIEIVKRLLEE